MNESVAPREAASVPALVTAEAPGALDRPGGAQMLLHNAVVAANWRAFHVGVPEGFTAYVYRYRDLAGNLLYVGMTSSATRRARMHLEDSDWISWVASVECRRCRSRDEAFKLESKIRNNERPLFVNQAGYAALMAELDARYQINHVAGTCDCIVDPRRSAGFMLAAGTTLPDQEEAQAISDRAREIRERLSNRPRRSRGRIGYGAIAVPTADGAPLLVPDTDGTAPIAAEASRRVIAGETVMSVTADLNKRGVPAKEGGLWHAAGLWKILQNPILAELGIVSDDEFRKLQAALNARAQTHSRVDVPCRNYLDVIYCGRCGAKVYRWHQKRYSQFFGRCRNECKRYETACPCDLPMAPYEMIDKAITDDIQQAHGADLVETRLADAVREERVHGINAELVWLAGRFTAKAISREDYLAHQADLMDEAEALQADNSDTIWTPTGETVGEQWARLTDGDAGDDDARLWLLRLGVTYTVECVRPRVRARGTGCGRNGWLAGEWTVTPSWPAPDDATVLDRLIPRLP